MKPSFVFPRVLCCDITQSTISISSQTSLYLVGVICKAHGLKGLMSLTLGPGMGSTLKVSNELVMALCPEVVTGAPQVSSCVLSQVSIRPRKLGEREFILGLEGVEDRTKLDTLLPFALYAPRELFPPLEAGNEAYVVDLLGRAVAEACRPDVVIGEVVGWYGVSGVVEGDVGSTVLVIRSLVSPSQVWELPYVRSFFPGDDTAKGERDAPLLINLPEIV